MSLLLYRNHTILPLGSTGTVANSGVDVMSNSHVAIHAETHASVAAPEGELYLMASEQVLGIGNATSVSSVLFGDRSGLRDLLATLDLGIAMARDPDGTIRHWSRGCERLYGWKSEDAIGRISHDLLQTRFPIPLAEIEAALERDGEWTGDLHHRTRDGDELVVTARKVLRKDKSGKPVAVMESIADVTAQRKAEQEVIAKAAQLAQAAKMEALGQLAAGIAHDFNNILQLLVTSLELAARLDRDDRQRLLSLADSVAKRGAGITRRLLAFARQSDLRVTMLAPASLLTRVAEMLRPVIEPTIELRVDASLALPAFLADSNQIETVLVNLVNNARDAMPQGGSLTLRATAVTVPGAGKVPPVLRTGAYICISVIDTGEGMSKEVIERVTEPFYTTKPLGKGTGLGLAMAQGFVEQSGGAISIDSTLGQGTTVSLWLPHESRSSINGEAGGATVLLVEDETELRLVLTDALANDGYSVVGAKTAAAALTLLNDGLKPDVIVTDYAMPGSQNGIDLIQAVHQRSPRLPVILITGYIGGKDADKCEEMQCSSYVTRLSKPFLTAELEGLLAMMLARNSKSAIASD
jgi:PAS domain S-box-containing protein